MICSDITSSYFEVLLWNENTFIIFYFWWNWNCRRTQSVIPESGLLSAARQIDTGSDWLFSGMARSNSLLSWDQHSAGPTWGRRKWPQWLAPVHSAVQTGLKGHMAKPPSPESCSIIHPSISSPPYSPACIGGQRTHLRFMNPPLLNWNIPPGCDTNGMFVCLVYRARFLN